MNATVANETGDDLPRTKTVEGITFPRDVDRWRIKEAATGETLKAGEGAAQTFEFPIDKLSRRFILAAWGPGLYRLCWFAGSQVRGHCGAEVREPLASVAAMNHAVAVTCLACGAPLATGQRFCAACGTAAGHIGAAPATPLTAPSGGASQLDPLQAMAFMLKMVEGSNASAGERARQEVERIRVEAEQARARERQDHEMRLERERHEHERRMREREAEISEARSRASAAAATPPVSVDAIVNGVAEKLGAKIDALEARLDEIEADLDEDDDDEEETPPETKLGKKIDNWGKTAEEVVSAGGKLGEAGATILEKASPVFGGIADAVTKALGGKSSGGGDAGVSSAST